MQIKTKIFNEANIRKFFDVSVILKGIDGFFELIGAFLLLIFSPLQLNYFVVFLTRHELSQDPDDFIATHLLRVFENFSVSTKLFEAFYLLVHGLVKIFLVWGLLRKKIWAYPTALVFLFFFMAYQLYRYSHTHAGNLIILTIFDLVIFVLTWHEYKMVNKALKRSIS